MYESGRWNRNDQWHYEEGIVHTRNGIVSVYRQSVVKDRSSSRPLVMLEFCYRGRTYRRTWERFYSPRYCVTLAKHMASEIVEANR